MNAEDIYKGITEIREEIVEEAPKTQLKRKRPAWRRWAAVAACAALAGGLAGYLLPRIGGSSAPGTGGGGHAEGSVFMSYAGPILPLTLLEEETGLLAARALALDFAPQQEAEQSRLWSMGVTDAYTLTNESAEDKTVTLAYPFVGSFRELDRPALTLDGAPLSTTLHAGPYTGGFRGAGDEKSQSLNLDEIHEFSGYRALLADGGYMASALQTEYPALTDPVTVYELTNVTDGGSEAVNPTLNMAFHMDYDKSIVLTYGFNGGRYDPDTGDTARNFSIPKENRRDYGATRFLAVLGEDIGEYTLQGYENGACEPGEEINGAGASVTRYETTLGELLLTIAQTFYDDVHMSEYDGDDNRYIARDITFDMYFGEVCRFFAKYGVAGEEAKERYDFGMLEDIINETVVHSRVLYLAAEITVPAGGSVVISARSLKRPSYDFACTGSDNVGVLGYELATSLGSSLDFTEQSASLVNYEKVELVRQNFGFDLAAGITSVSLDPAVEHYYIEVRPVPQEQEAG